MYVKNNVYFKIQLLTFYIWYVKTITEKNKVNRKGYGNMDPERSCCIIKNRNMLANLTTV